MWNFLKNLFQSKPKISYSTGVLEGPADPRDISISQVQAPIAIPAFYRTDLSMLAVENQLGLGTCVAQSNMKLAEYYLYKKNKIVQSLSARAIYKWCKEIDGMPGLQGTYASSVAKILTQKGIPLASYCPNFNDLPYSDYVSATITDEGVKDALSRKLGGYAFVPANFLTIKQAIFQNGAIVGITDIDENWFIGLIQKVTKTLGRHSTLWYGYDQDGIYARNSWGNGWIAQALGLLMGGDFYFKWEDYKNNIYEVLAYVDIPDKILDDAKSKSFVFYNNLRYGDVGPEVVQLQKRLNREINGTLSFDGKFFSGTRSALMIYQKNKGLTADGIFGPASRAAMNTSVSSNSAASLDAWCDAIKAMEGALPSRNNPGNLRYIGQQYAVNDRGFCKFDTYEHGIAALKNLIIRACTGKISAYNPDGDLTEFFRVYAPQSDNNDPVHYAKFVADRMDIPVTTKIRTLV